MAVNETLVDVRGTGFRDNLAKHIDQVAFLRARLAEVATGETLGGAKMHSRVSGVNDHLAEDEHQALAMLRQIVASLPPETLMPPQPLCPPRHDPVEFNGIVSDDPKQPCDAREIITRLMDGSEFHEFKPLWGETLETGFGAIHGQPVAILANNGVRLAESAFKGAHFIELANQRGVTLLFLQTSPASWLAPMPSAAALPSTAPRWCMPWPVRACPS